ncbi:hypothetical protein GWI33_014206 [Rhynchophorus ferrugineus]|uniref:Uncharacterized protein n=1 Tax=Rhynchophorus ferrugineus TaxID=354439 RepID=A0A834I5I1_RHYFE|nr:hypothetical protein GWI33_014206 [Rhynchophorus ferrugineus]
MVRPNGPKFEQQRGGGEITLKLGAILDKQKSEVGASIRNWIKGTRTPHSPRRQKLNLRMKSLSLDSPESTEHVQRRQRHGANAASDPHSNHSSSSKIQFASTIPPRSLPNPQVRKDLKAQSTPSSPVHNRRLLSAKNIRMSSVELPDENDKSPSSASTSPCPSPVGKGSPYNCNHQVGPQIQVLTNKNSLRISSIYTISESVEKFSFHRKNLYISSNSRPLFVRK